MWQTFKAASGSFRCFFGAKFWLWLVVVATHGIVATQMMGSDEDTGNDTMCR